MSFSTPEENINRKPSSIFKVTTTGVERDPVTLCHWDVCWLPYCVQLLTSPDIIVKYLQDIALCLAAAPAPIIAVDIK